MCVCIKNVVGGWISLSSSRAVFQRDRAALSLFFESFFLCLSLLASLFVSFSLSLDDNRGRIENKLNQKLSQLLHYHLRVALSILLSTIVSLLCPGTVPPPSWRRRPGSSSPPLCHVWLPRLENVSPRSSKRSGTMCELFTPHSTQQLYRRKQKERFYTRRSEDR